MPIMATGKFHLMKQVSANNNEYPVWIIKSKRLSFGIHSAQEVFFKKINHNFEEIDNVKTDIDEILIWVHNNDSKDRSLIDCLERVKEIGLKLKIKKSRLQQEKLVYFGQKLFKDALHTNEYKIRSTTDMSTLIDTKNV